MILRFFLRQLALSLALRGGNNTMQISTESEIKALFKIVWRWLWLLILCVLISAVTAYTLSTMIVPVYRASTTLLIDSARTPEGASNVQDLIFLERLAQTWARLMEQNSTLVEIADQLEIDADVLKKDVVDRQVTPLRDTQLMRIDIESVSPTLAALVANTMPGVFSAQLNSVQTDRYSGLKSNLQRDLQGLEEDIRSKQIQISDLPEVRTSQEDFEFMSLQSELSELLTDRRNLRNQLESIRLTEAQSTDGLAVVEAAEVPVTPIRPRILINTALASIAGLLVALAFVFLIEFLDDRLRSPREIRSLVDLPLLGSIAVMPKRGKQSTKNTGTNEALITLREPRHPLSEAYRGIRTALQFDNIDEPFKTIVVTSALPNEGKSTTAANLAIVMAQAGYKVALIDADMRKSSVHQIFDIPTRPGLIDAIMLEESQPLRFSPERQIRNLYIMPTGLRPPNPAELLGSKRMKLLIDRVKSAVDIVIFDTPPVLAVTDAQILSTVADKVLLVVSHGTKKGMIAQAVESLRMVNAPLVGCVFNRLERSQESTYYYNEYYGNEGEWFESIEEDQTLFIPTYSSYDLNGRNGNNGIPKSASTKENEPASL
ncbi:MAG: polysaccharide biosynthesis tyrosine autokinase [Chloroflexota bacterium]